MNDLLKQRLVPSLISKRQLLALLTLSPLANAPRANTTLAGDLHFSQALQQGSCAVLIRHAQTEAGIGDPPGFSLAVCSSQRQLSEQGRTQSRAIGRWFSERSLQPSAVRSSLWCRCTDTADLAFGAHQPWPALNSTFGDGAGQPAQTRQLRERLLHIPSGRFEVWVTHQVNMTDLTGAYPGMGEAFLVSGQGRLLARHAWIS